MLWLKGIIESLLARLRAGVPALARADHPAFEPGWGLDVALDGQSIGRMGLIRSGIRHAWRMHAPMAVVEMKLEPLLARVDTRVALRPVPPYPGVRRDLALLAPPNLSHGEIVDAIRQAGPQELTDIRLFDIFKAKEQKRGTRSLAYTLEFRSAERTLTDDEVNTACQTIMAAVKTKLGVDVREG